MPVRFPSLLYFGYKRIVVVGNTEDHNKEMIAKASISRKEWLTEMNMILKRQLELKKKNGKKGFTLIEVIVVIVILAILAAIAVPALTGYIDKANQRAAISEAAQVRVGLQTISTDSYTTGSAAWTGITFNGATNLHSGAGTTVATDIYGYSPISGATATIATELSALIGTTVTAGNLTDIKYDASRTLTDYKYVTSGGYTVTFVAGNYTVA
jgi:prepilin-type N-terminal cleavage/methylation domain-containing protein